MLYEMKVTNMTGNIPYNGKLQWQKDLRGSKLLTGVEDIKGLSEVSALKESEEAYRLGENPSRISPEIGLRTGGRYEPMTPTAAVLVKWRSR
ncbi:hypothetical protein J6590_057195 [Homalodisca vitripennis]|nr:hypothetical protein J6590_057195 [Homalodisca vitripennis]